MGVPVFIDAAYAAEMLHITPEAVLDLVREGQLRPYGGRAPNYFFRSADVAGLATALPATLETEVPKRTKSGSARVQTRLTADARWSDISNEDIHDWAARADATRRQAARKTAIHVRQRLETVLQAIDELEGG